MSRVQGHTVHTATPSSWHRVDGVVVTIPPCGDAPRHLIMHCFLPMMAVPVVAVGKPRALLYDESGYESDWQWLPLARGQRYRDSLNERNGGARSSLAARPETREFASEAISPSVGHALAM